MSKTLHPNASRGEKCKFLHPQGGPDEEAEDSEDDQGNDQFALARRRSMQEDSDNDKDQNDRGNSGARSSWE